MKKSLSPAMMIAIVAAVMVIIGLVYWKTASPAKNEATIDNYFKNSPMSGMSAGKAPQPATK